jgi:hypothetical protein
VSLDVEGLIILYVLANAGVVRQGEPARIFNNADQYGDCVKLMDLLLDLPLELGDSCAC